MVSKNDECIDSYLFKPIFCYILVYIELLVVKHGASLSANFLSTDLGKYWSLADVSSKNYTHSS